MRPKPLGSAPSRPDRRAGAAGTQPAVDLAALATGIVGLLRRHTGRGPTRAKAVVSSDLVLVTLGDCLTTAESRLAATGNSALVADTRASLHAGMRAEATAIVERLTHRRVVAYLTAQHDDPDLAILAFFLAPAPSPGAVTGRA